MGAPKIGQNFNNNGLSELQMFTMRMNYCSLTGMGGVLVSMNVGFVFTLLHFKKRWNASYLD